jgi:glycosidase
MNFSPDEKGRNILDLCKKLTALRKHSRALREGDFTWIDAPVLAFRRTYRNDMFPVAGGESQPVCGGSQALVFLNNSTEAAASDIELPPNAELVLSSGSADATRIEPMGYRMYFISRQVKK